MPGNDMPLEQLKEYKGRDLPPKDFYEFWEEAVREIKLKGPTIHKEETIFSNREAVCRRVFVTAPDGCVLSAKYIRPKGVEASPLVIQFHDYPEAARSCFHLLRYASIGYAVLAPDCRSQGGESGTGTVGGPLFAGLGGNVKKMYLYHLITDALLWVTAAQTLEGIESSSISVYGEGQGGGLALACAGMYSEIRKCGAHYPMLCDYRRVWEMDFMQRGYDGLAYYFRWQDPLHKAEEDIFHKLQYVDVKNFSAYIQAETIVSTGLQDQVSPPSAQFAVVNGMNCPRKHMIYPKHGHELNNFFENEWLKFLLKGAGGNERL